MTFGRISDAPECIIRPLPAMGHDVFISHAAENKSVADAVCATLEQAGIRCWIAPRDILPSSDWGDAIVQAISQSKAFVLVFSSDANASRQVPREVERAIEYGVPIIPFRIEDVRPRGSLEYQLATVHWLDALSPPLESHIDELAGTLKALIGSTSAGTGTSTGRLRAIMRTSRAGGRRRGGIGISWTLAAVGGVAILAVGLAGYLWFAAPSPPDASAPTNVEPATESPVRELPPNESSRDVVPPGNPAVVDRAGVPASRPTGGSDVERLKQLARSNGAFTCDGFYCSVNGLRGFFPIVRRVVYGESPSRMTRSIVLQPAGAGSSGAPYDLRYIAYEPGSEEMYSRLEFVDGTTTDVTPASFNRDSTPIAGTRAVPQDPAAPALFIGYRQGGTTLTFVPDAPPGTAAVMYSLQFDGGTFERAQALGSTAKGFQFQGPVQDVFVRVRMVMNDGSERGPYRYVAAELSSLVITSARHTLDYLRSPSAVVPVTCKRLNFSWPQSTAGLSGQDLTRARSRSAQAERHLREMPFVTRAPVVACVAGPIGRTGSWGSWTAVQSVQHWVPGVMSSNDVPVRVDWDKVLDKRFGTNPADAGSIWRVVLPAETDNLRVQLSFGDGTQSAQLRVPIEDVRLTAP